MTQKQQAQDDRVLKIVNEIITECRIANEASIRLDTGRIQDMAWRARRALFHPDNAGKEQGHKQ